MGYLVWPRCFIGIDSRSFFTPFSLTTILSVVNMLVHEVWCLDLDPPCHGWRLFQVCNNLPFSVLRLTDYLTSGYVHTSTGVYCSLAREAQFAKTHLYISNLPVSVFFFLAFWEFLLFFLCLSSHRFWFCCRGVGSFCISSSGQVLTIAGLFLYGSSY